MPNKRLNPPKALPAATVILVREYQAELQVYLYIEIDARKLEKALLPAGEPFSRIWYREGPWRSITA